MKKMKQSKKINELVLSEEHELLLTGFRKYLKVLGYVQYKGICSGPRELLWKLEEQNTKIREIKSIHIEQHYDYLQSRPSQSGKGKGSLSMITIKGYLYGSLLSPPYSLPQAKHKIISSQIVGDSHRFANYCVLYSSQTLARPQLPVGYTFGKCLTPLHRLYS